MIHSTLYSCDICHLPYNSNGTGGVCTWSWAGVGADKPLDLCPECLGKVRSAIMGLQDEHIHPVQNNPAFGCIGSIDE